MGLPSEYRLVIYRIAFAEGNETSCVLGCHIIVKGTLLIRSMGWNCDDQLLWCVPSPDETTSLVSTDRGGKSVKCWIFHHAFPLLFILTMASLWVAAPMASAAVKYEMAEWGRIHGEMVRDIARLRVEKNGISDDLEQLRVERDEQRREWELEREENEKRRRGHVPFWGPPRLLTGQCPKDRIRRYEARMYNLLVEDDWHAACMREHVQIPGRGNVLARTCVNQVHPLALSDELFIIRARALIMVCVVIGLST